MVTNSPEDEEQCILDTCEPAPLHESDSESDNTADIPVISYKAALDGLEGLSLFPHLNAQKREQLEALLYREKQDIERLQGMARSTQLQSPVFLSLSLTFPSFVCTYPDIKNTQPVPMGFLITRLHCSLVARPFAGLEGHEEQVLEGGRYRYCSVACIRHIDVFLVVV